MASFAEPAERPACRVRLLTVDGDAVNASGLEKEIEIAHVLGAMPRFGQAGGRA